MKIFSYGILLFVFWLSLSGRLDPLLLGLGLMSVGLTLYLANRMNVIDHESYPLHLSSKFPAYFLYILIEIVKANMHVIGRILTLDGNALRPRLIQIPVPQKTDLGRVIYANSITLTPGTVSVSLTENVVTVHALTKQAADGLSAGDMAAAIPDGVVDR